MTSDSDYMSVNDTLLRPQGVTGNNNEPIYHTLDDDFPTESKSKQVMMPLLGKEKTVYINADLVRLCAHLENLEKSQFFLIKEVVYPNISKRRDFTSDDDDDDCDAEFEHLLRGGQLIKGSDCDDYENDQDDHVPSPAPGIHCILLIFSISKCHFFKKMFQVHFPDPVW